VPRFLLVVAPTLEPLRLVVEATRRGWAERRISRCGRNVLVLEKEMSWGRLSVELSDESVAKVASGARLVIGLGGTANQICAGLGVPVVSILEKGKLVQKKLLRDAEVLVPSSPEDLSEAAERILEDAALHAAMSDAGKRAMGRPEHLAMWRPMRRSVSAGLSARCLQRAVRVSREGGTEVKTLAVIPAGTRVLVFRANLSSWWEEFLSSCVFFGGSPPVVGWIGSSSPWTTTRVAKVVRDAGGEAVFTPRTCPAAVTGWPTWRSGNPPSIWW
jgi:hypothetical protein